jgi:hypothetical protein
MAIGEDHLIGGITPYQRSPFLLHNPRLTNQRYLISSKAFCGV